MQGLNIDHDIMTWESMQSKLTIELPLIHCNQNLKSICACSSMLEGVIELLEVANS